MGLMTEDYDKFHQCHSKVLTSEICKAEMSSKDSENFKSFLQLQLNVRIKKIKDGNLYSFLTEKKYKLKSKLFIYNKDDQALQDKFNIKCLYIDIDDEMITLLKK